jgi:hypothetical protein
MSTKAARSEHDNAYIAFMFRRSAKNGGEEFLDEESVAEVIRPELELISVLGKSRRLPSDASITDKNVKPL